MKLLTPLVSSNFDFKTFLNSTTNQPGVYRMYDKLGKVIYVGKAKDLKQRLSSYSYLNSKNEKTKLLISYIQNIDITVTHTEIEALLLEHNYIKFYQPKYNVLLRDDKSYPYIFLSNDIHPRLTIYRGKCPNGEFFGPFPNGFAIKEALKLLQKVFPIRQCKNDVYQNRSRPCLLYQINRCLAPCIKGLVSDKEYAQQVQYVRLFLSGRDNQIITLLIQRMEKASTSLHFEEAIKLRNQIKIIRQLTTKQYIDSQCEDLDVIGMAYDFGIACIHLLFIRQNKILGSQSFFPKIPISTDFTEIIQTFLGQYYLQGNNTRTVPVSILLNDELPERKLLQDSLEIITGRKITIINKLNSNEKEHYLQLANTNALAALKARILQNSIIQQRILALESFIQINKINRIECFDISHTMGDNTTGACVVFNRNGPLYSEYRRYNIKDITPGNDYAAINQVLLQHYKNILTKNKIPDVIIIDGGKGQLAQAQKTMIILEKIWNKKHPILIAIAKNKKRKKGLETLFLKSKGIGISLPNDSLVLQIIQHIRNHAHNYAICGHRKKQSKIKNSNILEKIQGIGPKRKRQLLQYMGGLQPLINANIEDLVKVPGISCTLAKKIYFSLKNSSL
ncbi:excinuclease ABC subunit UvrC [Pantoea sp. Mhis]|uniref:excinuclease ABC subunit UvrC n=1 Tax=Pantoea sp. Mhis TaxID=2576759 RepID=UPI0013586C9E|nr:excinuclease ABC subunit UvrC [Pantoea sp. Mhis]MXP56147.1 excinuclease ABC subunit UvrC [Pantoea sp. Mhis]